MLKRIKYKFGLRTLEFKYVIFFIFYAILMTGEVITQRVAVNQCLLLLITVTDLFLAHCQLKCGSFASFRVKRVKSKKR